MNVLNPILYELVKIQYLRVLFVNGMLCTISVKYLMHTKSCVASSPSTRFCLRISSECFVKNKHTGAQMQKKMLLGSRNPGSAPPAGTFPAQGEG